MAEMRVKGTGVAIPGLNSTALRSVTTLIPSQHLVQRFDDFTNPCLRAVFNNCKQSRTLATLRDALLPRLLSGEIRVKEADTALGTLA